MFATGLSPLDRSLSELVKLLGNIGTLLSMVVFPCDCGLSRRSFFQKPTIKDWNAQVPYRLAVIAGLYGPRTIQTLRHVQWTVHSASCSGSQLLALHQVVCPRMASYTHQVANQRWFLNVGMAALGTQPPRLEYKN